jgi:hypothetical protein
LAFSEPTLLEEGKDRRGEGRGREKENEGQRVSKELLEREGPNRRKTPEKHDHQHIPKVLFHSIPSSNNTISNILLSLVNSVAHLHHLKVKRGKAQTVGVVYRPLVTPVPPEEIPVPTLARVPLLLRLNDKTCSGGIGNSVEVTNCLE